MGLLREAFLALLFLVFHKWTALRDTKIYSRHLRWWYHFFMTFSSSAHCSLGTVALQTNLQQDIASLCDWSSRNRMILNTTKTKSMLVTGKRLKSQINRSGSAGRWSSHWTSHAPEATWGAIDEELTFKKHFDQLCKKISPQIGLLNNMRTYLPIREGELF